jgi:MFS family permease
MLAAIVVFLGGSIVSARSPSMTMLVGGRTVQGIGGGGLVTLVEVLITDLVPLVKRGAYFSILSLVWAVGTVVCNAFLEETDSRSSERWCLRWSWSVALVCPRGSHTDSQDFLLKHTHMYYLLRRNRSVPHTPVLSYSFHSQSKNNGLDRNTIIHGINNVTLIWNHGWGNCIRMILLQNNPSLVSRCDWSIGVWVHRGQVYRHTYDSFESFHVSYRFFSLSERFSTEWYVRKFRH